ncbi:MAG: glycosyl transferase [Erysipelotrichaceae bacterium]|nr:glycosyl transferase [Erysipelotrichaceae bacterium]
MDFTNVTTRESVVSAFFLSKDLFKNIYITDACYLSNDKYIIALAYKQVRLPLLNELLNNYEVRQFFLSLPPASYLLDYRNKYLKLVDNHGKITLISYEMDQLLRSLLKKFLSYGGYLNSKNELMIDLKGKKIGPHYGVNLLLGNRTNFENPLLTTPKSVVDEFGGGSFRGDANYQILATRRDILPEENGNPFNRQFYIIEKGNIIFYSGLIDEKIVKATTKHCENRTEIVYETKYLIVKRYIFILPQKIGLPSAVETQIITVQNLTKIDRELEVVLTGMFGLSNPECAMVDIIYQTVINQTEVMMQDNNKIVAIMQDYYPKYFKDHQRFAILKNDEGFAEEFTNNCPAFLNGGTIDNPKGINKLDCKAKMHGANFFALKKYIHVKANSSDTLINFVGCTHSDDIENIQKISNKEIINLLNDYGKSKEIFDELANLKRNMNRYNSFINLDSTDRLFSSYVNNTLPFQVLYQTFVSRSFSQTQKGYREIGFREIQDLYASMYYLINFKGRKFVLNLLSKWIENIYEFGYANHNFYYVGKEPGMCSDDALWLIEAIYRYISYTSDFSILHKSFNVAGSNKRRKLKDTIKAIILYSGSISVGKHGLPLLDSADWNDCLKVDPDFLMGPEKEKEYKKYLRSKKFVGIVPFISNYSESIMNAFLLIRDIRYMIDVFNKTDKEYSDSLKSLLEEKTKAVQQYAYKNDYFVRVLINRENKNNISYIGSKGDGLSIDKNVDGSYYLNSFSWSLLSDVASDNQVSSMLNIVEKVLQTPAGFKLCSNSDLSIAGSKQSATDHYFPGDRENGGVFKHAAMMCVVGMLKRAKVTKNNAIKDRLFTDAFFMINLVLPYKTINNPYVLKGNPRFCTQYNNSVTMENIGPILSGTATWLTLAIYEIIGVSLDFNKITISPSLPKEIDHLEAKIKFETCTLNLIIKKHIGEFCDYSKMNIRVDGKDVDTNVIDCFEDKKEHSIFVSFL